VAWPRLAGSVLNVQCCAHFWTGLGRGRHAAVRDFRGITLRLRPDATVRACDAPAGRASLGRRLSAPASRPYRHRPLRLPTAACFSQVRCFFLQRFAGHPLKRIDCLSANARRPARRSSRQPPRRCLHHAFVAACAGPVGGNAKSCCTSTCGLTWCAPTLRRVSFAAAPSSARHTFLRSGRSSGSPVRIIGLLPRAGTRPPRPLGWLFAGRPGGTIRRAGAHYGPRRSRGISTAGGVTFNANRRHFICCVAGRRVRRREMRTGRRRPRLSAAGSFATASLPASAHSRACALIRDPT